MTMTAAKWSLDEYHQMIAANILAGRQVELLNGEIIEMAPEGPEHAQTSTDATDYLRELLGNRALIRYPHASGLSCGQHFCSATNWKRR